MTHPCRCRTVGGDHIDRSQCLRHPSGNRRLARALVLAARAAHPCWHAHRTDGLCRACPCPGCAEFRGSARDVLAIAGLIDAGRLLPDDERQLALEAPMGNLGITLAARRARAALAEEARPPAEALPPGLRDRPIPAVTKRPAPRRTTPPPPAPASPPPAPAITAPSGVGRPPTGSPPAQGSTRKDGSPRKPITHGLRSGYHRHVREGVPFPEDSLGGVACGCRRAQAEYMQRRNRAARSERAALIRRGA